MIARLAKKLKGEAGQCSGCHTTIFSDEDYVAYRGGVWCVDCAVYSLKRPSERDGKREKP